ncbi:dimethylarginine dimethylaminohydrolase family protein [Vagococcus zengguangii]|uniref:N(G),N(G)-dimethylarginine dimethylaminohydrolase n=1 Tax=Vagococcus zengguangii TaxID=2571750 RepID=A0A4D7CUF4_9ENTE|nr:arginine deiminase family protein [Vagococcus zengguangii]QCI86854.1 N(G),N(G)-dimethylarginine dimethylaminohydrolase [Vagococcus zengguangii]TLG80460.1 N(G),N(G)-dimethylarginine dimethylaminohydrolase [Vagococcus zengguangii]
MFKNVIVRVPSSSISEGLTSANEGKPIYSKALMQHENYVSALTKTGVNVTVLEPQDDFPDSCFVEDVALCTSKCAIVTRPGALSRRKEAALPDMIAALEKFYENIEYIKDPGTVEAGDIMMVGDHFYIGLSARTNEEGAKQMIEILEKYGLSGQMVEMKEMLHLKTGLAYLENNNLLVAGEFKQAPEFEKFNKIEIDMEEAYGANCIWINDYVIVPEGYPVVQKKIEELGYKVLVVDTSEFRKIDGGLSCLSLRF